MSDKISKSYTLERETTVQLAKIAGKRTLEAGAQVSMSSVIEELVANAHALEVEGGQG